GVGGRGAVRAGHAEVVDILAELGCAARVYYRVVGDVAGEAEAHQIRETQQRGLLIRRRAAERTVRFGEEAGGEALIAARAERPAATHRVADAIRERADARAG